MTQREIVRPPQASPVWTRAWIAWILTFFIIEETALLRRRPQDTLSDHVWAWCGIPRKPAPPRAIRIRRLTLLSFLAWLSSHFLSGDEV